jgi:phytoene dehydrogenase-like protein
MHLKETDHQPDDVAIIGGGLAGLAASVILAQHGRTVTIIEKSTTIGGRARTIERNGFYFNHGPHALYPAGPGVGILKDLNISYKMAKVKPGKYHAIKGGKVYPLPLGLGQLLGTRLIKGSRGKTEAIKFFMSLKKIKVDELRETSLQDWLDKNFQSADVKGLIKMLSRLATYSNDSKTQSAGLALSQIRAAVAGGVEYVDKGWQTIVNGLVDSAKEMNVRFLTGKSVLAIENKGVAKKDSDQPTWRVFLSDGNAIPYKNLIIAGSPGDVYNLLKSNARVSKSFLNHLAEGVTPVRVATMDIALSKLPNPESFGAYGIDDPLYLSVHSAFAKLAPEGGAMVHVMKNMDSAGESNPKADREELENFMDQVQPGWRNVVVKQRFLPNMTVSNALVCANQGGTVGRPDVKVPAMDNLYIIGDWVGPEGMLADASLASAKRAAEMVLREDSKNKLLSVAAAPAIYQHILLNC